MLYDLGMCVCVCVCVCRGGRSGVTSHGLHAGQETGHRPWPGRRASRGHLMFPRTVLGPHSHAFSLSLMSSHTCPHTAGSSTARSLTTGEGHRSVGRSEITEHSLLASPPGDRRGSPFWVVCAPSTHTLILRAKLSSSLWRKAGHLPQTPFDC